MKYLCTCQNFGTPAVNTITEVTEVVGKSESWTKKHGAPKRVCMIAYTAYPYDGRVRLEAESLVTWGYEVIFLVPKQGAKLRNYTLDGVRVRELNVSEYDGSNKLRYALSYVTFLALAFLVCTSLYFRSQVSVVHVHNMPDILVLAAIVPRLFGCKVILDLHDTVMETYLAKFGKISPLFLWLLRMEELVCCSLAHLVICVNHVQREIVIQRGTDPRKIATVITMPKFLPDGSPSPSLPQSRAFRMVNHGTISKRLGNDLIIEAAAKLIHEIPGFELHFIGGGDNLGQLLSLCESLDLGDHVHFHKGVPWDKLAAELRGMDVGIVANRVNAATELMLPSKLIDYVALGIPAIVPRLKAIEYYFLEDEVSFFEPENVDSMVAATLRLYKDRSHRERQVRNAKSFLDKHGWDSPGSGLKSLYDKL